MARREAGESRSRTRFEAAAVAGALTNDIQLHRAVAEKNMAQNTMEE